MKRKFGCFCLLSVVMTMSSCFFKSQDTAKEVTPEAAPVVHEAHLSSEWYNQMPTQLHAEMDMYLAQAQEHFYVEADPAKVRALIVPHAGYYYSGLAAASAYQTLLATRNLYSHDKKNKQIKRVVIFAPSHTKVFNGVALPDFNRYKTVLGELKVEEQPVKLLAKNSKNFRVFADAYQGEHSLELQLPWLQKTIENFTIIPLMVGHIADQTTALEIAQELKKIIDEQTLVVVSSDFVHHGERFDYQLFTHNVLDQVRMLDSMAVEAIVKGSYQAFDEMIKETRATICGRNPIRLLLTLAELEAFGKPLESYLASYYTSAHLMRARKEGHALNISKLIEEVPDKEAANSVSYVAMAFTHQKATDLSMENRLTGYEKKSLLKLSRDTLTFALQDQAEKQEEAYPMPIMSAGMSKTYGAFVTLKKKDGSLRGCIGHTYSYQPLARTIVAMTKAAAFNDDRFEPLTKAELDEVTTGVSILSQPQRATSIDEIIPGKHGVILNKFKQDGSMASAVFLPQVAREQGWDRTTMLRHLSRKAGLDADAWQNGAEFYLFEGHDFSE